MTVLTFSCPTCRKELRLIGLAHIAGTIALISECKHCRRDNLKIDLGDAMHHLLTKDLLLPVHFAS